MKPDVDLLRDLMLTLEGLQRSPRTTVVLSVADEADDLGRAPAEVEGALTLLLDLGYIDGAGADDDPGYWMFRKLTRKGADFVAAARRPGDWRIMKERFGAV